MTQPFKKVGRGGAGNFYSKEDIQNQNTTSHGHGSQLDLESHSESSAHSSSTKSAQSASEYLHTGRGGAGNWVQPSALQVPTENSDATLPTSTSAPLTLQEASRSTASPTATYRGGRGGAGNYSWEEGEEERKRKEEEAEKQEEVRRKVVNDVEMALPKPGRAVVGDTVNRMKV